MNSPIKKFRCAVYTRKSSDEGLEQSFNSLDAQREAAVAYISSQRHEGWELITTHYDDGGFSGGSTDRPALQLLLSHIEEGKVDVIVVYKVDRLSRSLHDFAQMMTLFEKHNVSFVSVTQQFNTTTSMGRLTLNILLSFAQFEREVTGERIRDKVAASKKKGMWMGGMPPLGYEAKDRQLLILEKEAELVRRMFTVYLESHSLLTVAQVLNAEGHTTKVWISGTGRNMGGKPISPGYLNWILRNVIYIGKVRHRKEIYEGQHEAIIDQETWEQVQASIQRRETESRYRWKSNFLLKGKMKTHEGYVMTPSTTHKEGAHTTKRTLKKQVRYYVSRKAMTQGFASCAIKTLNAVVMEDLIRAHIFNYLNVDHEDIYKFILDIRNEQEQANWIRQILDSVIIGPDQLVIYLSKKGIHAIRKKIEERPFTNTEARPSHMPPAVWHKPVVRIEEDKIVLTLSIQIQRIKKTRTLLSSDGKDLTLPAQQKADPSIIQAIGRGFSWQKMMNENPNLSFKKFEATVGYCDSFIAKHLLLVRLAPDILHRALTGDLPSAVNLTRLYEASESLSWTRQRQILGLN